jgi:hypothetical protein
VVEHVIEVGDVAVLVTLLHISICAMLKTRTGDVR